MVDFQFTPPEKLLCIPLLNAVGAVRRSLHIILAVHRSIAIDAMVHPCPKGTSKNLVPEQLPAITAPNAEVCES
ncbi:hypothetical protein TNCV_1885571 [Trichonephila clavipes]|nr:hypothetical protein TNCV_1885571 [Trichonephila clavipes]